MAYSASLCITFKFPGNVVVVLLTLLWIKMSLWLAGCLYVIVGGVLKSFPVDGFFESFPVDGFFESFTIDR